MKNQNGKRQRKNEKCVQETSVSVGFTVGENDWCDIKGYDKFSIRETVT
jgi:hypothetical protein